MDKLTRAQYRRCLDSFKAKAMRQAKLDGSCSILAYVAYLSSTNVPWAIQMGRWTSEQVRAFRGKRPRDMLTIWHLSENPCDVLTPDDEVECLAWIGKRYFRTKHPVGQCPHKDRGFDDVS